MWRLRLCLQLRGVGKIGAGGGRGCGGEDVGSGVHLRRVTDHVWRCKSVRAHASTRDRAEVLEGGPA